MKVHSCREHPRIPSKSHRRQKAAIGPAPQPYAFRVNVGSITKILARGYYVLIFRSPARSAMHGFTKRPSVADAAAIVDRQDNVASTRKVLVERICVVVVLEVVPPKQHLADRPAVTEYHRRRSPRIRFWLEQL